MAKRAYSRDFTPRTERRVTLSVNRVPPTLAEAVRTKIRREGLSLRSLLLRWLSNWTAGRRPDEDDGQGGVTP